MIINCKNCKEEFDCPTRKFNYNSKNNLNIFCSYKCYTDFKIKNRIITKCVKCGKEISKTKSSLKNSKTGNLYCSKSCSNSMNNRLFKTWKNHPNYNNGIGIYRKTKLKFSENKCEDCGITDIRVLQIHHKDRNRKNNELENLSILCANCHKIRHYENVV